MISVTAAGYLFLLAALQEDAIVQSKFNPLAFVDTGTRLYTFYLNLGAAACAPGMLT